MAAWTVINLNLIPGLKPFDRFPLTDVSRPSFAEAERTATAGASSVRRVFRCQVVSTARRVDDNWRAVRSRPSYASIRIRVVFVPKIGHRET